MFTFSYLPQLAILVFVNGPIAVVSTVLLVLNESTAIVNGISRNFLLEDAILDTFDGTLLSRNKGEIVKEGREIKSGSDPIQKLGKALKKPFERFGPKAIIRYFMYLPLNFIPIVGTVLFIFLQSKGRGHQVHNRVLSSTPPLFPNYWLTFRIEVLSTKEVVSFAEVPVARKACWAIH
jgi:hypothetical protein